LANINDTVSRRFEAGGLFEITPQGGTALTVLNIETGSLEFKPVMTCAPIEFTDRGALQTPVEGSDEPGEISLTLRVGKHNAELLELMTTRKSSPDGAVRLHTITIKIPAARGGSTGDSIATTSAYLKEVPTFKAGEKFDTVTLKFGINDHTIATY
jgi:hypothetical protein